MNPLHRRFKRTFSRTGEIQFFTAGNQLRRAAGMLLLATSFGCQDPVEIRMDEVPLRTLQIASVPYVTARDVWVEARYSAQHTGVDLSALKAVPIRAPGTGVFHKTLYYYEAIQRWQVNAEIRVGDWAIDCLFEPGNEVTQQEGRAQFDALVADGTRVNAGDSLGMLLSAKGASKNYFHLGVRLTTTDPGTAYCPMPYCTESVRGALLELYRRDHPHGQICDCHVY